MDEAQKAVLDQFVFHEKPPTGVSFEEWDDYLMPVLAISDRNTTGLGGPTRADHLSPDDEHRDFVDFMRNVGTARDKHLGGGTYGFGKASLYLASDINTIIVYTRCHTEGKLESRFMVAALGEAYKVKGGALRGNYTGRHWWGRRSHADGVVDPVTGRSADVLAEGLGLPAFDGDQTGTTIAVLAPRLDTDEVSAVRKRVEAALLWSFWPKMLHTPHRPPSMKFKFSWEGKSYSIEAPTNLTPLIGYVQAMENLKAVRDGTRKPHEGEVYEIRSQRPRKLLGHLSLVRFIRDGRFKRLGSGFESEENEDIAVSWGPERRSHHVALMRNAELVVRYLEGPSLPTDLLEYAGVFITDDQVDDAFARSEPPTHDDWQPKMLDDRNEKTYINVAFREMKSALKTFTGPLTGKLPGSAPVSLGAAANFLGGLVPAVDEGGGGTGNTTGGRGSRGRTRPNPEARQPEIELLDDGVLESIDNRVGVRFRLRVHHADGTKGTTVKAVPEVLINDGKNVEKEAPEGDEIPTVVRWEDGKGKVIENTGEISLASEESSDWSVLISMPNDAMIRASFIVEAE
jgi:hypothetical protein